MIQTIEEPIVTGIDLTITRLGNEVTKHPPHSMKRRKLQEHLSNLITIRRQLAKDLNGE
jgi:hypothetical protein